mmetsp:Transcript_6054/g.13969  ORF Transcript_6054/g.13969 Transcript_6054/m.13969 type:complete len:91 (+) Transcript_6054:523-795(+)
MRVNDARGLQISAQIVMNIPTQLEMACTRERKVIYRFPHQRIFLALHCIPCQPGQYWVSRTQTTLSKLFFSSLNFVKNRRHKMHPSSPFL